MKILASFVFLLPLCAQDASQPASGASTAAPQAGQDASKPAQEQAKPAEAAAPAPAAEAAPGESWLNGSLQIGYRWIPNIGGSLNTYRSVVNLGEGLRLLDTDFTRRNTSKILFDRADVHASAWGGDPYNTLRVDVEKSGLYRLTADYRSIAYFNFLPSFADPSLSQGLLLDQNSFDTRIRTTDVQLDLLPNKWITPYLGFSRNTQFGRGVTGFHTGFNDYPVASLYSDQTNTYRAGVRMELGRYHVTLEQGGTTFKDDQGASDDIPNAGNFTGVFLGSKLPLSAFNELYRVRGDSVYTKALLAANPFSWMSVTGQFVYARPRTDIDYTQSAKGTFYLQRILQFYSANQDVLVGDANMPHVSGNVTVELRPLRRLRVVEYWMTDRFHNAANALLAQNLIVSGAPLTDQQLLSDRLVLNSNREEIDAFYDLLPQLTLRGGYRFEWGDTEVRAPILTGLALQSADLRRHVGIAGVNYRLGQKLRITGDAEGSSSDQTFFRTSLQDYEKAHIRASYDLSAEWRVAADFSLLNNSNPAPNVKLDYSAKVESASVFWTPKFFKGANLLVDYARSAVRSNLIYLTPQTLTPTPSIYRDNGHSLSAVATVKWFSLGGSMYISSGSRPTTYYQPLARFKWPVYKHVEWITEWRWYSMAEDFYGIENFRSNQVMTSLRFSR